MEEGGVNGRERTRWRGRKSSFNGALAYSCVFLSELELQALPRGVTGVATVLHRDVTAT
jgi:hypothetical protein